MSNLECYIRILYREKLFHSCPILIKQLLPYLEVIDFFLILELGESVVQPISTSIAILVIPIIIKVPISIIFLGNGYTYFMYPVIMNTCLCLMIVKSALG